MSPDHSKRSNQSSESESGGAAELAEQDAIPRTKEPPKFAVLLHNDDYTTMEFVVEILLRYFHKNEDQAVQIMLSVHKNGKSVAGIYEQQIAETKVDQVERHAKAKGYPLKCSLEPSS